VHLACHARAQKPCLGLTSDNILSLADYRAVRRERRRRVEVGPFATFHFENFETMQQQVQEMRYIEKGGNAQLEDELKAYNPLIPQGAELVATVMFEIDDPMRRGAALTRLGGIENHAFIEVDGHHRVHGEPEKEDCRRLPPSELHSYGGARGAGMRSYSNDFN
jgi:Protein of unknown function (DUF3501)